MKLDSGLETELNEQNKCLEQKESTKKLFGGIDTQALKKYFGKKITELQEEKRIVQQQRDCFLAEVENIAPNSDGHTKNARYSHLETKST